MMLRFAPAPSDCPWSAFRRVVAAFAVCLSSLGGACSLTPLPTDPAWVGTPLDLGLSGHWQEVGLGSSDRRAVDFFVKEDAFDEFDFLCTGSGNGLRCHMGQPVYPVHTFAVSGEAFLLRPSPEGVMALRYERDGHSLTIYDLNVAAAWHFFEGGSGKDVDYWKDESKSPGHPVLHILRWNDQVAAIFSHVPTSAPYWTAILSAQR